MTEDEKSQKTIEKYQRDLRRFAEFAGDREIAKKLVMQYKEHLLEHYSTCSVNSMLVPVNLFLKKCGWTDCAVKTVRIQQEAFRDSDRELSVEDYRTLLQSAEKKNERLYYIMETLAATGIRISELRFITYESLQYGRAEVCSKGKHRTVLLPAALCTHLSDYASRCGISSGSLFVTRSGRPVDRSNVCHDMKKLCEAAGIDSRKVFPHNFRHLFAVTYYESRRDLTHLADLLGHSSIDTTRLYTLVSREVQEEQIDVLGLISQFREEFIWSGLLKKQASV